MSGVSGNNLRLQRLRVVVKLLIAFAVVIALYVSFSHIGSQSPSINSVATLEFDTSEIKQGVFSTVLWEDRPVLIYHRKAAEVAELEENNELLVDEKSEKSKQPDFAKNPFRSRKPHWFVSLNQGTDFGCTLSLESGSSPGSESGSYLEDTCRRSRYDLAGRVYQGQLAKENLVIPPYSFVGDKLILGLD